MSITSKSPKRVLKTAYATAQGALPAYRTVTYVLLNPIDGGTMSAERFYFKDSTLKRVEYGNGTQTVRAYDDARRLIRIDHPAHRKSENVKV